MEEIAKIVQKTSNKSMRPRAENIIIRLSYLKCQGKLFGDEAS